MSNLPLYLHRHVLVLPPSKENSHGRVVMAPPPKYFTKALCNLGLHPKDVDDKGMEPLL